MLVFFTSFVETHGAKSGDMHAYNLTLNNSTKTFLITNMASRKI